MDRLELIEMVKPAAIETMQNRRILASLLIAESVLISDNKKELLYNNPLDMRNFKTNRFYIFENIEDCFECFVDQGIIANHYENIIGNYDYKSVVSNMRLGTKASDILGIIESYKLNEIDQKVLKDMYDGRRTVVEIDHTPFMDFYRVRKSYNDKEDKLSTTDLEEAKKECDKWLGYSVFNSRGKTVYVNALTEEVKARMELEEHVPAIKPVTGSKIHLEKVNLYATPDATRPTRAITGDYYIYSGKKYNNRYMITAARENVGQGDYLVLGYINDESRV